MLLKYAIVAGLVVLGGMIFYTEIDRAFPNTASTVPASLQADVEKLGDDATVFVAERLNETSQRLEQAADETVSSVSGNVQAVQDQVAGSASALNPVDQIQKVFSNDKNDTATMAPTADTSQ